MSNISRQRFFEKNGFKMTNPYWAWSGVNNEKKLVLFNVWEHFKEKYNGKTRYIALCDEWKHATESSTGFNDSEKNINLVMHGDYKLCIAIAEPTFKFAMPVAKEGEEVKIKHIRSSFYSICDVVKEGGIYWATPIARIDVKK
ncbi:MAG: hypothetical protein QM504_16680 [Pseudomonadota bacterium]